MIVPVFSSPTALNIDIQFIYAIVPVKRRIKSLPFQFLAFRFVIMPALSGTYPDLNQFYMHLI